jgi:hypothetical protein
MFEVLGPLAFIFSERSKELIGESDEMVGQNPEQPLDGTGTRTACVRPQGHAGQSQHPIPDTSLENTILKHADHARFWREDVVVVPLQIVTDALRERGVWSEIPVNVSKESGKMDTSTERGHETLDLGTRQPDEAIHG